MDRRFMPPPGRGGAYQKDRPKGIKDVPAWLVRTVGSFFARFSYIIRLVWETSPFILILMSVCCICDGFLPVLGAYISKDLVNAVSDLLNTESIIAAVKAGEMPIERRFSTAMFSSFPPIP